MNSPANGCIYPERAEEPGRDYRFQPLVGKHGDANTKTSTFSRRPLSGGGTLSLHNIHHLSPSFSFAPPSSKPSDGHLKSFVKPGAEKGFRWRSAAAPSLFCAACRTIFSQTGIELKNKKYMFVACGLNFGCSVSLDCFFKIKIFFQNFSKFFRL